jgi:hypothetical protein
MITQEQISVCKDLNTKILDNQDILTSNADYSKVYLDTKRNQLSNLKINFNKNNCDKVLIQSKLKNVDALISKYSEIDKIRIETESFKQRNNKLILGAVILVVGLLIVATISKE